MIEHETIPSERACGLLPRTTVCGQGFFAPADAVFDAIPKSQWPDLLKAGVDLSPHAWHVRDQDGENSCAANAAATAVEIVRSVQGLPRVELSAASLYRQVNDGRDQGSTLEDNLRAVTTTGLLPVTLYPPNGWRKRPPADWQTTADDFRVVEWFDLPSYEHFMTALFLGYPIAYGVWWGRGGHAICAVAPSFEGNVWGCKFANSWGASWGENGIGVMPASQISKGLGTFGGWAARVAVHKGGDS